MLPELLREEEPFLLLLQVGGGGQRLVVGAADILGAEKAWEGACGTSQAASWRAGMLRGASQAAVLQRTEQAPPRGRRAVSAVRSRGRSWSRRGGMARRGSSCRRRWTSAASGARSWPLAPAQGFCGWLGAEA